MVTTSPDNIALQKRVADQLTRVGYVIGDSIHRAYRTAPTMFVPSFSLMLPSEQADAPRWRRWLRRKIRRDVVAVLWMDNLARDAELASRWTLEVYGRVHLDELTEMARLLEAQIGVEITITLKSELPESEMLPGDDRD